MRAAPDGLTLLSGNVGPQAIAYSLFRNLPYREDQLAPVSGQIRGPNVLVVNAASPVRTMADFVAWLRREQGRVTYASTGVGQSTHLSPVWMLQLLNAQAIHVPFRGSAPAQTELVVVVVDRCGSGYPKVENSPLPVDPGIGHWPALWRQH